MTLEHKRVLSDADFEPWFEKAQKLSQLFREIGMKYDVENTFAYPTIKPFKESKIGALGIPVEFGGPGGNILQISKVVSEMSRGDSAITLAYNMHFIMFGIAMANMSDEQNKYWGGRVCGGELIFGPFSEQRAGFSGLADTRAIPQPGGGWKLYGKKTWGTLSEAADIITSSATITDAEGNLPEAFEDRVSSEMMYIADWSVDEDGNGDGVRIEKSWNALGMHATGTHVIHFDGFFVPESGYICEARTGLFSSLEWASLMFASIYYGMSQRVLEESRAVLSKKTLGAVFGAVAASDVKVAGVGHIIDGVGDMACKVEQNRRILWQTCNDLIDGYEDEWPLELRVPYIGLAKTTVAANTTHMAQKAMSLVGGSAFRKGTIFERLYRDSCAAMYQPLNADQTYTYIGEYLLQPEELND
ncbi:acyl-CoA dehydrogenase family protein [Sporichthya sp.]|uniref:acyl-CoA dehydrogenase family protein n=1 Tax=Sporichthya sp. TaxID=65475 RepID=UPI001854F3AF|nr:acyl-CoA dehydrogenase family protein [Sporichthya sp.]MBA3743581.1 acyl-CoA/acyl-ACP dehydrogenase [Sporichthya sp.]